jgi:coproporphyrinogen III oxidase-like Fe-S oxidoreductase
MAPNKYGLSDEDYAYFLKTWRKMKQQHGLPKREWAALLESMRDLEAMGLIVIDGEMLHLTEKGRNTDPDSLLAFFADTDKEQ